MDIGTNLGKIASVDGVTVRLKDYRTYETVGSRGALAGGGIDSIDFFFEFNNVYEFDTFVDILLAARKRLTIQDGYAEHSYHSGLCDDTGVATFGEDLDYLYNEVENGRIPTSEKR